MARLGAGLKKKNKPLSRLDRREMDRLLEKGRLHTDEYFIERTEGLGAKKTVTEPEDERVIEKKEKAKIPLPLLNVFNNIFI